LGERERNHAARRARCADERDDLSCGERHERLPVLHREPHGGGEESGHDRQDVRRADGVTGMANETNRLANGYRIPVDPAFDK